MDQHHVREEIKTNTSPDCSQFGWISTTFERKSKLIDHEVGDVGDGSAPRSRGNQNYAQQAKVKIWDGSAPRSRGNQNKKTRPPTPCTMDQHHVREEIKTSLCMPFRRSPMDQHHVREEIKTLNGRGNEAPSMDQHHVREEIKTVVYDCGDIL